MPHALYLLALMPPPPIASEIRAVQEAFAAAYACKAGLKNPVHITLVPPFRMEHESAPPFLEGLRTWSAAQPAFPLTIRNFNSFRRNRVIFIDVAVDDALEGFQHRLEKKVRELLPGVDIKANKPYHPHFTIGYRDIPRHRFAEAEKEYLARSFAATFPVDRYYLWQHNGAKWEIRETLPLQSG